MAVHTYEMALARIEELEAALKATLDREAATHARHDARAERAEALVKEAVDALRMMKAALHEDAGPMALVDGEMLLDATLARIAQEGKE